MKQFFVRINAICRTLLVFAAMLCGTAAFAQNVTVKGTILDSDGLPLPGAAALIVGTTQGTISDENGNFSFEVNSGATVEISCLGFVSQTISVGGADMDVTITLQPDTQLLDEVVVTALGITRQEKTLGYALQEVDGESLLEARETNIANALTGKVAGVQIIRSSNGPGGSSKIQLRGNNSLTGLNQPLIVIDGTPMDNFIGADNNDYWNPSADMGNGLQDINPEDVESMSVLKGASAAALYGSRAGNGVILITTKKGKKNEGIGITVSQTVTATTTFMRPDYQTTYGQGTLGSYDATSTSSWGEYIDGQSYTKWDGSQGTMQYYDNLKNFLRTGVSSQTNVTLSQQYGKTGIYASATHMIDNGVQPEANLKRTNLMLRATTTFGKNERWHFDGKVQYIKTSAHNRPISGNNASNSAMTMYTMPTTVDIRDFKSATDVTGSMYWFNMTGNNPYWLAKYNQNDDTRDRFLMNASLKYEFTDWLNAELRAGSDMYFTETSTHVYSGNTNLNNGRGSYSVGESRFYENNFSFLISAQKDNIFGEWGGGLTFGGNMMTRMNRGLDANAGTLNLPNVFSLGNGQNQATVSEDFSRRKMNSLYGTAQINYGGFIFLDGTFRNDWTSTLSPENRSFPYPSVSLAWVIGDMVDKYWSMPDWFTYAKVRASFAQVGNDMDPYQLINAYTITSAPNQTPISELANILYDYNVRNELITSWEAGLELRFLDNRLGLDFAYYKSNATNQLINLPINPMAGYENRKINAGNIQNEGIELMINATPITTKEFNWDMMLNVSHNKNKILSLADGVERYSLGGYDNVQIYAQVGGDYGEIWSNKYLRVTDKSSPYYGQLVLDADGLPQSGPTEKVGTQQADANIGWTNTFSWKGFTLAFQIDARIGGEIFSGTQQRMQQSGNALVTVGGNGHRDDFVVEGVKALQGGGYEVNTTPVSYQDYWTAVTGRGGNLGIGEANIYDATNVRLRNLSLSYSFPKKLLERSKVLQSVKLGFSVNNVCMIYSAMDGIDPESVFATSTNATGFEYGGIPTSRSFVFNVSFGF